MSNFDKKALGGLIDGDAALLEELLRLYISDWPMLLDNIRVHLDKGNAAEVEFYAHRLKGVVRNFFAADAARIAGSIEELARDKKMDSIGNQLAPLSEELRILEEGLKGHLETLKT